MTSSGQSSKNFDTFHFVCYIFFGYAYWSLIHGLGPMIWFYPLNELDITGYEAFVLVAFSPILFLLGDSIKRILKTNWMLNVCLFVMLGGCASFHSQTTLARLVVLSLGVAAAFVVQCALWWSNDTEQRKTVFWGFTVGFLALLSSRIWYVSFTPLWNDCLTNKVFLAIFATVLTSRLFWGKRNPNNGSCGDTSKVKNRNGSCVSASLGYGAAIFILHALFGEVSLISRYAVQGYPNHGPSPNPWGGFILVMLTFGLFLSMHTKFCGSYRWSLFGIVASAGVMFLRSWPGFICGACLAAYIMSVWPIISERMVDCENPGKSLLIANTLYLLGVFGMVWCTAYNFVPFGGELARERTYVIMGVMMLLVAWAATRPTLTRTKFELSLSLPELKYYVTSPQRTEKTERREDEVFGKTVKKLIFFIAMAGLLGFEYRKLLMPTYNSLPSKTTEAPAKEKQLTALIWTFHFGYDNEGWPSMERAAALLNNTGADVITLLESDASKPYLGNNDLAMWLGEKLGMYVDFGPSTKDHTWGNLLLSKYPIVYSQHHLLPSPHGELAPAISATVNVSGSLVDFIVTHMGNDRDNLDRLRQAKYLSYLCEVASNPVVFLGYVTSSPGSRDYKRLLEKGNMKDIDPTDKERWCEYIMYRGLVRLGYARISHGGLSDTELQMGRWQIPPKDIPSVEDNSRMTTDPGKIAASVRFNSYFGKLWESHWYGPRNHFHMGTPKYFIP